jgi:hypothetical protein
VLLSKGATAGDTSGVSLLRLRPEAASLGFEQHEKCKLACSNYDGGLRGRMKWVRSGGRAFFEVRQGSSAPWTRVRRRRSLPTKNGHAVLCSSLARVIREYQSDSSSKHPNFIRPLEPPSSTRQGAPTAA